MLPPEHLWPLAVVAIVIGAVLYASRIWPGRWIEPGARVIAVLAVLAESWWWLINVAEGTWTVRYNLPLHICEAGSFLVAIALWTRARFAFEMSYFWALGGALPGLFTPNIPGHFPDAVYFQYYAEHGLLVLGALYMVITLGMRPGHHAVQRAVVATATYAVVIGAVDYFTGGNYLFLRNLPPTRTLLDYMGPWPWYIVSLTILAILIFSVLYLPFARTERRQTIVEAPAV